MDDTPLPPEPQPPLHWREERALCLLSFDVATLFSSQSGWSEITLFLRQSGLIFGGVLCLWRKRKHKELFALCQGVSVGESFFWIHSCCIQGHTNTPYPNVRNYSHLRLIHSSNWRQTVLCIPLVTMISTSPLIFERHYQQSLCRPLSKHMHGRKQTRVHGTQWLLFIVHSFMWRVSCLAWYSIILQPTLSFPAIPSGTRRPQTHNSDCATHWLHSDQRYCCSEPHFSLLASPTDTEPHSATEYYGCFI